MTAIPGDNTWSMSTSSPIDAISNSDAPNGDCKTTYYTVVDANKNPIDSSPFTVQANDYISFDPSSFEGSTTTYYLFAVTSFGTPVYYPFTVSKTPCTKDLNSLANSLTSRVLITPDVSAKTTPDSPAASYFINSEPVLCTISYAIFDDDKNEQSTDVSVNSDNKIEVDFDKWSG